MSRPSLETLQTQAEEAFTNFKKVMVLGSVDPMNEAALVSIISEIRKSDPRLLAKLGSLGVTTDNIEAGTASPFFTKVLGGEEGFFFASAKTTALKKSLTQDLRDIAFIFSQKDPTKTKPRKKRGEEDVPPIEDKNILLLWDFCSEGFQSEKKADLEIVLDLLATLEAKAILSRNEVLYLAVHDLRSNIEELAKARPIDSGISTNQGTSEESVIITTGDTSVARQEQLADSYQTVFSSSKDSLESKFDSEDLVPHPEAETDEQTKFKFDIVTYLTGDKVLEEHIKKLTGETNAVAALNSIKMKWDEKLKKMFHDHEEKYLGLARKEILAGLESEDHEASLAHYATAQDHFAELFVAKAVLIYCSEERDYPNAASTLRSLHENFESMPSSIAVESIFRSLQKGFQSMQTVLIQQEEILKKEEAIQREKEQAAARKEEMMHPEKEMAEKAATAEKLLNAKKTYDKSKTEFAKLIAGGAVYSALKEIYPLQKKSDKKEYEEEIISFGNDIKVAFGELGGIIDEIINSEKPLDLTRAEEREFEKKLTKFEEVLSKVEVGETFISNPLFKAVSTFGEAASKVVATFLNEKKFLHAKKSNPQTTLTRSETERLKGERTQEGDMEV